MLYLQGKKYAFVDLRNLKSANRKKDWVRTQIANRRRVTFAEGPLI
jgi:hypothetical protein